MKKFFFAFLLALCAWSAPAQKTEPLVLEDSASWCMVLLPDPQSYIKFDYNQPVFELMQQWIRYNRDRLNIRLVLCTGDLVEQNNRMSAPDGINGNQTSTQQWQAVSRAFGIIDDAVPYILCTGNHDHGYERAENRYSQLNSYFPPDRHALYARLLKGMFKNDSGVETLENAWYEFEAPTGEKYLIVSLEFDARRAVVEAAKELVARPEYAGHRVVFLTHAYMRSMTSGNKRLVKNNYGIADKTCGEALWRDLIEPCPQASMVFCGHVVGDMSHRGHVGFRTDRNAAGRPVHQMEFNAQAEGGGWHGNGGDGWLRVLEFKPDGKTVTVHTFSPLFGISPSTADLSIRKEPYDYFSFELD